ncbi:MAG: prepilin-type N-terminal cleavage/methylation domain-containing protein [Sedimentisphaerales bacterium]|nr:prepilin-type N-terminal cleavage/methylation domain-containing protein [Sedimentisphaerales bacterium]
MANNKNNKSKIRRGLVRHSFSKGGFTLIEIVIAMSASLVVVLCAGVLVQNGHRSWARAFNYANSKAQLDALATTITFGSMGRKSNRLDYRLYTIESGKFIPAVASPAGPDLVVKGEAVEFHYWDADLNSAFMNVDIKGTAYAIFYLDGKKLMLDLGPLPPGGIDAAGNKLEGAYVTTLTLAENVQALEFSHTTRNTDSDGKGCVRLNMTIQDPNENTPTTVTAATLMRNTWGLGEE